MDTATDGSGGVWGGQARIALQFMEGQLFVINIPSSSEETHHIPSNSHGADLVFPFWEVGKCPCDIKKARPKLANRDMSSWR